MSLRRRRAATAAVGVAVVAAAVSAPTACSPAADAPDGSDAGTRASVPAPVPDDVAADLRVEVRQDRTQYAEGTAKLHVANGSDETLTLLSGGLEADGFGPSSLDASHRAATLRPGGARDVRIVLGEVDCVAEPPASGPGATPGGDDGAVTVPVTLAVTLGETGTAAPSGAPTEVVLTATDPHGRLAAVHGQECARRLVASGVSLRVRPELETARRGDDLVLLLRVRVEPVPGGPAVEVERITGTTLMTPADGSEAWTGGALDVGTAPDGADARVGEIVLDVVPRRCDPHAVAEDKRGTFVPVLTTVDGVEQPPVHLPMPDEAQPAFFDYLGEACGWE
jgi:hypothetical protein